MRIFTSFLLILSSLVLNGQISIEEMMSSPFPTSLISSDSDEKIAWVFNEEGRRNIWIAEGADFNARVITDFQKDDGQNISNLIFREESNELLFVRGSGPNRRGEIPNPTSHPDGANQMILSIGQNGGKLDTIAYGISPKLSPDKDKLVYISKGKVWIYDFANEKNKELFQIRGGVGQIRWSPDGTRIVFRSSRGDHSFIGVYKFEDHEIDYLLPSVDIDSNPVWSPDGTALAFIRIPYEKNILPFFSRRSALPWSIMVHNFSNGKTMEVWQAAEGVGSNFRGVSAANQLIWTEDNHLVFPYEGDGWTHIWSLSLTTSEAKNITPGEHEVQFVNMSSDKNTIYFSSNKEDIDRQHIWKVNPADGNSSLVSGEEGIQWSPVVTKNGSIFCLSSSGTNPAHVSRVQSGKLVPIVQPKFQSDALVEPEQVIFKSEDGMSIHGQLFKPKNMERGQKYPAVLFFHGGSRRQMLLGFHHRGYYHNAYALNQYLASQGYLVLSVNFRSGIGYGMEFREALEYGAEGASEFRDVLAAGNYMKSRGDVDESKIGLWGGSYGGYLTALGLAKASDLFAAGVDIHGVHDWNVVIKNFVPSYNSLMDKARTELAYKSSPMPYVEDWKSPVLLIHGDDDRNVPFSETVDIAEQLRKNDVYFEQLIFPDEVHGFLMHENWVEAFKTTADFFDRMLKED
jgi:dipeptidyl aminopeptidase/acylaminoacyl peptidase